MNRNRLLFYFLLVLTSGCTILSDDDLDDLPEAIRANKIELVYSNSVDDTEKRQSAPITYSGNVVEINWPADVDVFFYNRDITKTVYHLNAKGWAEKVTNTFEDGTVMEDVITYNATDQVVELTNSFFKDKLLFYYKNNAVDSVAKSRNSMTQFGFYKLGFEDEYSRYYYCVFPLDETKPYQSAGFYCNDYPIESNELNMSSYSQSKQDEQYEKYGISQSIYTTFTIEGEFTNCTNIYVCNIGGYYNFYGVLNTLDIGVGSTNDCYYCGFGNQGYLNSYIIMPLLFPDNSILNMVSTDNELKWITKNNGFKQELESLIQGVRYQFEPIN